MIKKHNKINDCLVYCI